MRGPKPADPSTGFVERLPIDDATAPRLAVKDMIAVAGCRRDAGLLSRGAVAEHDADVVARLRQVGFAVVGTTVSDAAGFGTMTPTVENPLAPGRAVGGSSGGSAAVLAAGLADVALGTDTGGSVRIPAAYCGLAAFKPSLGGIPMGGVLPLSPTFDVVGLMARDAATIARAASSVLDLPAATARPSPVSQASPRLLISSTALSACEPSVRAAVEIAIAPVAVALAPLHDPAPFDDVAAAHSTIVCHEALWVHRKAWRGRPEIFPPAIAGALAYAETLTNAEVDRARVVVSHAHDAWNAALGERDVLVMPTLPMAPAARRAQTVTLGGVVQPVTNANIRLTLVANVAGLPVLVLPCGGLSLQFIAGAGRDALLLGEAASLAERLAGACNG